MSLSVAAVPTVTYHWLWLLSYWIGCPKSPAILSDTLLSIWRIPPLLLMVISSPETASLSVWPTLTWSSFIPSVIAKYTVFESNPSGRCPFSAMTRTVSPSKKLWSAVKVKVLFVILLIPAADLPTVNSFIEETWVVESSVSGITIRALCWFVFPAASGIRTFNLSFFFAPIL